MSDAAVQRELDDLRNFIKDCLIDWGLGNTEPKQYDLKYLLNHSPQNMTGRALVLSSIRTEAKKLGVTVTAVSPTRFSITKA